MQVAQIDIGLFMRKRNNWKYQRKSGNVKGETLKGGNAIVKQIKTLYNNQFRHTQVLLSSGKYVLRGLHAFVKNLLKPNT